MALCETHRSEDAWSLPPYIVYSSRRNRDHFTNTVLDKDSTITRGGVALLIRNHIQDNFFVRDLGVLPLDCGVNVPPETVALQFKGEMFANMYDKGSESDDDPNIRNPPRPDVVVVLTYIAISNSNVDKAYKKTLGTSQLVWSQRSC